MFFNGVQMKIDFRPALMHAILAISLIILPITLSALDIPDLMTIDNWGYEVDHKGPVPFRHRAHSEEFNRGCSDCHHGYAEGDSVRKCKTCHSPLETVGVVPKLSLAYHGSCRDCHMELYYSGKPAGPFKKCNDCHEALTDGRIAYVSKEHCGDKTRCYKSIQEAVDKTPNAYTINIESGTYSGPIVLNDLKGLTLLGGWDSAFQNQAGSTMLRKTPRAPQGMLKMRNLIIKP